MQGTMLDVGETESNKSRPCPQRVYILVGKKDKYKNTLRQVGTGTHR